MCGMTDTVLFACDGRTRAETKADGMVSDGGTESRVKVRFTQAGVVIEIPVNWEQLGTKMLVTCRRAFDAAISGQLGSPA